MKKRMVTLGAGLLVLALIGSPLVMAGQMPMGGQGREQEQPAGQQPMMGRGMTAMMDPAGMMSGGQMDPKAMARMLEFRGDLLKAMGEVMLKHAKAMEAGQ
jgi:hypothetical protein